MQFTHICVIQEVKGPGTIPTSDGVSVPLRPPKRLMFLTKLDTYEPVTVPPLVEDLSPEDLERIKQHPFQCNIPCHSQAVEHTVALVTKSTKQYRTEKTQLAAVLSTAAARKEFKGKISHKRFKLAKDKDV